MSSAYEGFALRLAEVDRPASYNFLNGTGALSYIMRTDFETWIIRNKHRVIAVDTGFSAAASSRRGRMLDCSPAQAARLLGMSPDEVTHLVITHMHYAHAGNYGNFASAKIWGYSKPRWHTFAGLLCAIHAGHSKDLG